MGFDLGIDHNIKKQWIPFLLNNSSPDTTPVFTFRSHDASGTNLNSNLRIRICPSQDIIKKMIDGESGGCDIAHRLLFSQDSNDPKLGFDTILQHLPAIQIREFLQDSRINEIENLFSMFTKGMKFFEENKDKKPKDKACVVQKIRNALQNTIKNTAWTLNASAQNYIGGNIDPNGTGFEYASVMSIPYLLYTKLIASTTQNYYILPYNGKAIFDTNGTYGYSGTGGLKGWNTNGNSLPGKALNFIGAQVRVDTTPRFSAGGDSGVTTINITLDLFNDSKWGAITNFIMINTLFPGNMWMQYHLFNVAPNLYDIKVEGLQRLYMCTGEFKCECKGQLRTPSEDFLNTLKEYANTHSEMNDKSKLQIALDNNSKQRYIKIPDVYSLNLTFKSLLPNNLNSYLWQFSNNNNVIKYNGGDTRDGFGSENNDLEEFVNKVNGDIAKTLKKEA